MRGAADRLVRVGGVLFLIGLLATVATVLPLLLGTSRLPTGAYLLSMLMPAGLGAALVGLLVDARARRPDTSGPAQR